MYVYLTFVGFLFADLKTMAPFNVDPVVMKALEIWPEEIKMITGVGEEAAAEEEALVIAVAVATETIVKEADRKSVV